MVVPGCRQRGQRLAGRLAKVYLPSVAGHPLAPANSRRRCAAEKPSLYRLGLKSFFEEGRSLAQISQAPVVSVLNFFRENETVYMVHELPGGRDPAGSR